MPRLRLVLNPILALSFASAATAEPTYSAARLKAIHEDAARVAEEAFKHTMTPGLTARQALAHFGARYKSAADRKYLKETERQITSEEPVAMRGYKAIDDGFEITAPNGRAFTLTMKNRKVFVNGKSVALDHTSARHTADALRAALKTTFVTRFSPWLGLMPEAEASGSAVIEKSLVWALGAMSVGAVYLWWTRTKRVERHADDRRVDLAGFLSLAGEMCVRDKAGGLSFAASQSRWILSSLEGTNLLPPDGSDRKECAAQAKLAPTTFDSLGYRVTYDGPQIKKLCEQLHLLKDCLQSFPDRQARPINPPDGATPAQVGGGSSPPSPGSAHTGSGQ